VVEISNKEVMQMRGRKDTVVKLRVKGLHKNYSGVNALTSTDIDVANGEFLTLLGPSGSGKTTLLMLLSGLVQPDGGEILIDGKDATHIKPFRRDIGFVFQNYALFPHLTIFENIAFPLRMRRESEADIKRKVLSVLDVVQLPHVVDRLPRELSGGQQQRIAFARAAVFDPSIILMDEPLGALDKKLRDQMQMEIKQLHAKLNSTVVYVTHDQEEAMAMSDRICLMRNGAIAQLGSPSELYFQPVDRFVADFFGWTNFLPVTVIESNSDAIAARLSSGELVSAARMTPGAVGADNAACLTIRPQNLHLSERQANVPNEVPVRYKQPVMVGAITKHYCETHSGVELVVSSFSRPDDQRWEAGILLYVSWSADDALIVDLEQHR
jgi:putative spermidine/putrescine transport system ATP-binding protein